jgi:transcription elongation factor GreA
MEIRLSRAKVIDLDEIEEGKVYIFTRVTVKDLHSNKQFTYSLVPEDDADFAAGKISVHSPIAKGLLGLRAGESAEIQVPAGVKRLEVLSIERIAE